MVRAGVDIHPHRQFATMTALLVAVNVAVFVHLVVLGDHAGYFLQTNGAVPHWLLQVLHWRHPYRSLAGLQTVVAGIFLQPSWLYLAANVLFLLLFGPCVEDRLGPYRFLLLFVVVGVVAVLVQSLMTPDSRQALVGAQAGVAGVSGACLALGPRGSVPTMIRGVEFPWAFGPVAWLAGQLLLVSTAGTLPDGVGVVSLPLVFLSFAGGLGLGPLYRHHRPALLRG